MNACRNITKASNFSARIAHHSAQVDLDLLQSLGQHHHRMAPMQATDFGVEVAACNVACQGIGIEQRARNAAIYTPHNKAHQGQQHTGLGREHLGATPAHHARQQPGQHHQGQQSGHALGDAGALPAPQQIAPPHPTYAPSMQTKGNAPGLAFLVHAPVQGLGLVNLRPCGFGTHRHIAPGLATFHERCDVGVHPVMVAIFAPVFHHARPTAAMAHGSPQVFERFGRHIRVAHDVVRLADQFLKGKATDAHKSGVAVGDIALCIGGGHQQFITWVVVFLLCNWQIGTHSG